MFKTTKYDLDNFWCSLIIQFSSIHQTKQQTAASERVK